ncbi:MAG: PHP domain-containing protein [Deltaproteobacteria bacterium]|nr:PHP domain-containing protein [Deltaproteobacteria bacterium]
MREVDLHVHTTASDGTMTPAEVVRCAKEKGLRAMAITDHDTVEGVEEGMQEGKRINVEVIPGVEVSVDFPKGTMHLLGYYIEPNCAELVEKLMFVQRARAERNIKMVKRLRELGIEIDLSEEKGTAGHGQTGRPHFAQILVQKGYARDIQDAFDRFLRKGGPAYVEKFKLSPREAMKFIINAGGIPVLAHPFTLNQSRKDALEKLVMELKSEGLEGIEVYYPDHTEEQKELYRYLAQKHGLFMSGGSDFHGLNKEGVELGEGYGDMELPYSMVEELKARRKARPTGT